MDNLKPYVLSYYDTEVVNKISNKYGIEAMDALRRFWKSETYQMLTDDSLEMWDFWQFSARLEKMEVVK